MKGLSRKRKRRDYLETLIAFMVFGMITSFMIYEAWLHALPKVMD